MADSTLPLGRVPYMRDVKLIKFDFRTSINASADEKTNREINARFHFQDFKDDDGNEGLSLTLTVEGVREPYYNCDIVAHAYFDYPSDCSKEDKNRFLFSQGSFELYNAVRMIAKTATSYGVFGSIELPPLSAAAIS